MSRTRLSLFLFSLKRADPLSFSWFRSTGFPSSDGERGDPYRYRWRLFDRSFRRWTLREGRELARDDGSSETVLGSDGFGMEVSSLLLCFSLAISHSQTSLFLSRILSDLTFPTISYTTGHEARFLLVFSSFVVRPRHADISTLSRSSTEESTKPSTTFISKVRSPFPILDISPQISQN